MSASESQQLKERYEFGPFRVDPEKEVLLRAGQPVALTPKTFQILLVLLRRHKEVVTKDDLMKAVWPDTYVEENNLSRNIFMLRKALGESPQDHQYILTVPGRGYRFAEDVQLVAERDIDIFAASHSKVQVRIEESTPWRWVLVGLILALLVAAGVLRLFFHRPPVLTEKDTVVLADFANSTGDPVFDGTLRQGLSVQLEQSPYLNIISERKVDEQLKLMGRSADERLTLDLARDLCQRAGGKAVLSGSISRLGTHYVIGLNASRCDTGDPLGSEQVEADNQEHVLKALGESAKTMRSKLGESLPSVQKYDAPIEQATTPSLEALRAYSLGMKTLRATGVITALPFFQRAVELDPTFAMAYTRLGMIYAYLSQPALLAENIRKAYELRAKVSVRERLQIEQDYYRFVKSDQEKVVQFDEVWQQTYPQDVEPYHELTFLYARLLGNYEASLREALEAVRLDPDNEENYSNLCYSYRWLNRLNEAALVLKEAEKRGLNSANLLTHRYELAFLKGDQGEIERLVATSTDGGAQIISTASKRLAKPTTEN